MSTQKEAIEKLVELMKKWQKIEDDSIKNTTDIIKKTENPLLHIIMEIIRQDSAMHRRVQQLIIEHFTSKPITLNPDELAGLWDLIEIHNDLEKKTVELAKESLENTKSPFASYLLEYLLTDEEKHVKLLEEMAKIKKGMYPYGGM